MASNWGNGDAVVSHCKAAMMVQCQGQSAAGSYDSAMVTASYDDAIQW